MMGLAPDPSSFSYMEICKNALKTSFRVKACTFSVEV